VETGREEVLMEAASKGKMPLQNRLGIKGWAWAGRYKIERYLYTLHRLTGLGLFAYITLHLVANGSRLWGEGSWESTMRFLSNPGFKVGEYLVIAAFIFHAVNGGRLMLQQLGFTLGKPKPPIYPYVDALRGRRSFMWISLVLIIGLAIYVLVKFATK
jgi:succinate dehydrogenase / fumarate reductase cytochrome b subunit